MIGDELRNTKPYAVPVQFLALKSISDDQIRQLEIGIENAMKDKGMVPVGMYNHALAQLYTVQYTQ